MKPIYQPKGKAKEYAEWALNIYKRCPHGCTYCFAPSVLKKNREWYHGGAEPRDNIVEETKKQLEREQITGKLIELCFSCDPYPTGGYDSSTTREIIKLLKEYGNHVQILTKGDGSRDFDLLDENDWYGITISCYKPEILQSAEPNAIPVLDRLQHLHEAHERGIKTWVSFEPVLDAEDILTLLAHRTYVDKVKIGKLNYHQSDINWAWFGKEAERLCKETGTDYYIKESLRAEMEKKA
jgi:DNA repair photolyase